MTTAAHGRATSTLVLAGLSVVAAIGIGCWFSGGPDDTERVAHGPVTVVAGPDRVVSSRTTPGTSPQVVTPVASEQPRMMAGLILRQYPQLRDVAFDCGADGCRLAGSLNPPTSDHEREQRQEMLLGGLERLLAGHQHPMTAAIQMDEIGDDEFRIRVATR